MAVAGGVTQPLRNKPPGRGLASKIREDTGLLADVIASPLKRG